MSFAEPIGVHASNRRSRLGRGRGLGRRRARGVTASLMVDLFGVLRLDVAGGYRPVGLGRSFDLHVLPGQCVAYGLPPEKSYRRCGLRSADANRASLQLPSQCNPRAATYELPSSSDRRIIPTAALGKPHILRRSRAGKRQAWFQGDTNFAQSSERRRPRPPVAVLRSSVDERHCDNRTMLRIDAKSST